MPKPLKAPKFKSKEYKNTGFTKYVVVTNPWLRPSRSQHFADGMNEWFKVMMGNSDSSTPVHSVYLQTNKDYIIVELDGSVNLDEILGAHHTEEFFQNPAPNRSHSTSEIFEYNFTRFGDPNTILKWDFVMPSTSTPAGPSELAIKKDYPPPQEPHSVNPPAMACGISSEVKEAIAARRESYERSLGKGKSSIAFGSKEGSPASTKAPIPSSSTTSSAPSSSKPTPIPHPAPPPPAPHRAPDPASASRAGPSRPPYPSSQTRGPRVKEEKDHRREANRQPDGNGFVPYAPSAMFAAMRDRRERERELERERGHGHGRDTQSDRKWDNSSSERRVGYVNVSHNENVDVKSRLAGLDDADADVKPRLFDVGDIDLDVKPRLSELEGRSASRSDATWYHQRQHLDHDREPHRPRKAESSTGSGSGSGSGSSSAQKQAPNWLSIVDPTSSVNSGYEEPEWLRAFEAPRRDVGLQDRDREWQRERDEDRGRKRRLSPSSSSSSAHPHPHSNSQVQSPSPSQVKGKGKEKIDHDPFEREMEDSKQLQAQAHTGTRNYIDLQSNGANHTGSSALKRHPQVEREVKREVKVEEGVTGVDTRGGREVSVGLSNTSNGGIVVKEEPGNVYHADSGHPRRPSMGFDLRMRGTEPEPKLEPDEHQRKSPLSRNAVSVKSEEDHQHSDRQRLQTPRLSSGYSSASAGSLPVRVKEETRDGYHSVKREDPESNAASDCHLRLSGNAAEQVRSRLSEAPVKREHDPPVRIGSDFTYGLSHLMSGSFVKEEDGGTNRGTSSGRIGGLMELNGSGGRRLERAAKRERDDGKDSFGSLARTDGQRLGNRDLAQYGGSIKRLKAEHV